ncbi:PREDICTED: uncharacterized protein LOC109127421 [Camelina sativa]|uniref:Uncharacterized protein LOC109127421 n=1 Tax=Camelina sativa TaxID=90675 RepID=A0ABM1QLI2_CAMSA|nr:PREDICTED: uncharacterized protein LOC109127421 [Camelina sativa]
MEKWAVELSEYDIEYRSRPSLKSQVLADFITELSPELGDPTPNEEHWTMFVDGSSSHQGSGVGLILRSPIGEVLEQALKLNFKASNNETKYVAVLAGLWLARGLGVTRLQVFCDSQLVVSQFSGEFDAKNKQMGAYCQLVRTLSREFTYFSLTKVPRNKNASADTLAALANCLDPDLRRVHRNIQHRPSQPNLRH